MTYIRRRAFAATSPAFVSALGLLVVAGAGSAAAQPAIPDDRSFEVQLFQSPVGPRGLITLDSAHVPAHKQFGLALVSSYQRGPFSIKLDSDQTEASKFDVVSDQMSAELTGAVGLYRYFEIGVAIPLTLYLHGDDYNAMGQPTGTALSGGGVGDIRLDGKIHAATFGPGDEFVLSFSPGLTIPTGAGEKFLGEQNLTARLRALTEFRKEAFRAVGMAGLLVRQTSYTFEASVGSQFLYGVGAEYRLHRQLALLAEWFGRVGSTSWVDANPSEIDFGLRMALPGQVSLAFGGGTGLNGGIGSPNFRGFFAIGWAPDFADRDSDAIYDVEDRCPDEPEDRDDWKDSDGCPEADNDGDGKDDAQDRCPTDAEDLDQFQDDDGCPEADNDADGIPDLNDPCPNAGEDGKGKRPKDGCPSTAEDSDGDGVNDANDKCQDEPEDRDGFQDYDGCPDLDNDEDTIPDGFDACPTEAEDADGFDDTDGCPDPDNDRDGVLDGADKCPLQAETLNGNKDDDGCPDPGAEIVRVVDDRIEVRERIGFVTVGGKPQLTPGGLAVVKLVGTLLRGHDEIAKLRVEVMADGVSKDETQARADAIAKALIERGVAAAKIRATGLGTGGNRVDFVIESRVEPKADATKASPAPDAK